MSKKPTNLDPFHDKALANRTLGDLRVTGISNPLNELNKHQRLIDQVAGRSSVTARMEDEINKHQRLIDQVTGRSSVTARMEDEINKHQRLIDQVTGRSSVTARMEDEINKHQRLIDQVAGRSSVTARMEDEFNEHQRSLNKITQSPSFIAQRTRTSAVSPTLVSSPKALGLIVRETRKRMKMSQQEFADLAGVGRRFVSELERGKASLEFGLVLQVCEAAGIDILAKRK